MIPSSATTTRSPGPTRPDTAETAGRPLRADAARNRARILEAAQVVFAERGLDVTLDDIAKQAGLGVGTVYRRFADREALVEALFEEKMQRTVAKVHVALGEPDAWLGLVGMLRATCEELAVDRGMHQVLLSSKYGQDRVARSREQILPLISQLITRAQDQGTLRKGFCAQDIPVFFLMMGSVADFSRDISPELWRRYFAVVVDGLRARPEHDDPSGTAAALCSNELDQAMCGYKPRRR